MYIYIYPVFVGGTVLSVHWIYNMQTHSKAFLPTHFTQKNQTFVKELSDYEDDFSSSAAAAAPLCCMSRVKKINRGGCNNKSKWREKNGTTTMGWSLWVGWVFWFRWHSSVAWGPASSARKKAVQWACTHVLNDGNKSENTLHAIKICEENYVEKVL